MIDPVERGARAAADRLAADHGLRLAADVEAALYERGANRSTDQYFDPVSLGALIVSVASLAWTVYRDLKKQAPNPPADVVARTVRVRLREAGDIDLAAHERVVEITIDETLQALTQGADDVEAG